MDFFEALQHLKEGQKIRRTDWRIGAYLFLDKYNNLLNAEGGHTSNCIDDENIKSTWEVVSDFESGLYKINGWYHIKHEDEWYGWYGDNWSKQTHFQEYANKLVVDKAESRPVVSLIKTGYFNPDECFIKDDVLMSTPSIIMELEVT